MKLPSTQEGIEQRSANIWREGPNNKDGVKWVGGRTVARRNPGDREGAEQLGRHRMAGSTLGNEEGAKQPEQCQMIGEAPTYRRTPAARRALGNITLGVTK